MGSNPSPPTTPPGSSSGRTAAFEAEKRGSSPWPGTNKKNAEGVGSPAALIREPLAGLPFGVIALLGAIRAIPLGREEPGT